MDDKIQKAFDIANYMESLSAQKHILLEEFQQNQIFYHNGGTFTVTKELILWTKFQIDIGQSDSLVIIDDNSLPIEINGADKFLESIISTYTSAVNEYYTKYSHLKKSRTIEGILNV